MTLREKIQQLKGLKDYEKARNLLTELRNSPDWTYINYGYPIHDGESMNDVTDEYVYYNANANNALHLIINDYSKRASVQKIPENQFESFNINKKDEQTQRKTK